MSPIGRTLVQHLLSPPVLQALVALIAAVLAAVSAALLAAANVQALGPRKPTDSPASAGSPAGD